MKLISSLLMTAMILFSTLVVTPAASTIAARPRINRSVFVPDLEPAIAFALLAQDGGMGDIPEPGQRCREAWEALKKAGEALAKSTGKAGEAFARVAKAAGVKGKLTLEAVKEAFPRTWNLLVSRGAALPLIEMAEIVGFIHFLIWLCDEMDEMTEGAMSLDLQDHGMPRDKAEEMANFMSDIIAHTQMGTPGPGGVGAEIMHYRELLREGRKCELESRRPPSPNPNSPRNGSGKPHTYPSLTDGAFPGIGTITCGSPGYSNNDPGLSPSEPGTNGTQGSFDGGIDVTGVDPCR